MQATWIGFRAVRGLSTAALLWVSVVFADAEVMAGIEGRYVYDEYSLTLPNGSVVDLAGSPSATPSCRSSPMAPWSAA